MEDKRRILVTGAHRSGTTWIGRTVSQHPRVRYVHEPFNVVDSDQVMRLKLDTWYAHCPSSSQREAIRVAFDNLLDPVMYAVNACRVAGADIKTPLRFGKHLLSASAVRPRVLVKDPIALLSASWLHETYGFKVIVMIRNPVALVGSLKRAQWDFDCENLRRQEELMRGWLSPFANEIEATCAEGNKSDFIDRAALLWNILHFVILEYQSRYPGWLFVKHEDLAVNPKSGFREIFDYLGLSMDRHILKYIEDYTSPGNPKEAASSAYQRRDAEQSLLTWRERLTHDEVERVRLATRDMASHFYEAA